MKKIKGVRYLFLSILFLITLIGIANSGIFDARQLETSSSSPSWKTVKCSGIECLNVTTIITENSTNFIYYFKPKYRSYWVASDWATYNFKVYVGDYKQYLNKRDLTTSLIINKTGTGANTRVYSVTLITNKSINLFQLGNSTRIDIYENETKVVYNQDTYQLNASLYKWNGIAYILSPNDVFINNTNPEKLKFGAYDVIATNTTYYKYLFNSTKTILNIDKGYYIEEGESFLTFLKKKEYSRIILDDICLKSITSQNNITIGNDTLFFNNTEIKDICSYKLNNNTLEVEFYADYNSTLGYVFIDPSVVISSFSTYNSTDQNITQEGSTALNGAIAHLNVSTDVLMYFPFDINDTATIRDYGIGNSDGTLYGPYYRSNSKFNGGLFFDGVDDYMTATAGSVMHNWTNFTLSVWFNSSSCEATNYCRLFEKGGNNEITIAFATGQLHIQRFGGTSAGIYSSSSLLDSKWHNLIMTASLNSSTTINVTMYIDGIQNGSQIWELPLSRNQPTLNFGQFGAGGNYNFQGYMDEFLWINRSLSVSQVSSLYNNQLDTMFPSGEMTFNKVNLNNGSASGSENTMNISIGTTVIPTGTNLSLKVNGLGAGDFTSNSLNNIPITSSSINLTNITFIFKANNSKHFTPSMMGNITISIWFKQITASGTILYPSNTTYPYAIKELNYSSTNAIDCWFFNGSVNSSAVDCGKNFTGINSIEGANTWILYLNSTTNLISSVSRSFNVDTIAPIVNITFPINGTTYNYHPTINYTATDTNLQSCWWMNKTGSNFSITCGNNVTTTWVNGYYTIRVYANDTIGNVNYSSVSFTVDLLGCGNITTSGTYILKNNLTSEGTCFNINSSNVIIDCKGYLINYSTTTAGNAFYINGTTNVTIVNCSIYAFPTSEIAILALSSEDINVFNNTINSEGYGISLSYSTNHSIVQGNHIHGTIIANYNSEDILIDSNDVTCSNALTLKSIKFDGTNKTKVQYNKLGCNTIALEINEGDNIVIQYNNFTTNGSSININSYSNYTIFRNIFDTPSDAIAYTNGIGTVAMNYLNNVTENNVTNYPYEIKYISNTNNQEYTNEQWYSLTVQNSTNLSFRNITIESKISLSGSKNLTLSDFHTATNITNFFQFYTINDTTLKNSVLWINGTKNGFSVSNLNNFNLENVSINFNEVNSLFYNDYYDGLIINKSNIIKYQGNPPISLYTSSNVTIYDSVFNTTEAGENDMYFESIEDELNLTNVSFSTYSYTTTSGRMNVHYYINTLSELGDEGLQNVNVTITNLSGTKVFNALSNTNGKTSHTQLWWWTDGTNVYDTGYWYNVSMFKTGYAPRLYSKVVSENISHYITKSFSAYPVVGTCNSGYVQTGIYENGTIICSKETDPVWTPNWTQQTTIECPTGQTVYGYETNMTPKCRQDSSYNSTYHGWAYNQTATSFFYNMTATSYFYNMTNTHFFYNMTPTTFYNSSYLIAEQDPYWRANWTLLLASECPVNYFPYGYYSNLTAKCRMESDPIWTANWSIMTAIECASNYSMYGYYTNMTQKCTAFNITSASISEVYDLFNMTYNIISPLNQTYNATQISINISINDSMYYCGYKMDNFSSYIVMNQKNFTYYYATSYLLGNSSHQIKFQCMNFNSEVSYSNITFFTMNNDIQTTTLSTSVQTSSTSGGVLNPLFLSDGVICNFSKSFVKNHTKTGNLSYSEKELTILREDIIREYSANVYPYYLQTLLPKCVYPKEYPTLSINQPLAITSDGWNINWWYVLIFVIIAIILVLIFSMNRRTTYLNHVSKGLKERRGFSGALKGLK
jgi:hypothetical protein